MIIDTKVKYKAFKEDPRRLTNTVMVLIMQKVAANCWSTQISQTSSERQKCKNHFYRPFPGPHGRLLAFVRSLWWQSLTAIARGPDYSEIIFAISEAGKQQQSHWNFAFLSEEGGRFVVIGQDECGDRHNDNRAPSYNCALMAAMKAAKGRQNDSRCRVRVATSETVNRTPPCFQTNRLLRGLVLLSGLPLK